ncbi:MAG: hypothetical protein H6745_24495 [Deltaproteobacteria bacterium]|nr:hypothetical protein [Deltaproteobacteria bacterium]
MSWAALALLVLAHAGGAAKTVAVGAEGARVSVAVTYAAAPAERAAALRELFDRDRDGRLSDREGEQLAERLVEEATFALRVTLDGVAAPVDWRAHAASGLDPARARSRDDLAAVALFGVAPPLLVGGCGLHRVEVRDQVPGGGVVAVRWPDGRQAVLGAEGAATWVGWLCPGRRAR